MSTSKHKLITGELVNQRWHDFRLNEVGTEGNLCAANGKFVAASWQSAKSCIAIHDVTNPCRISAEIPLIRINFDPITDLKFSPFATNLLASSADDGAVRFWTIPDGGLVKDMEEETQKYTGHIRKVLFSQFHPCSADVCASASSDNTVQSWNILTAQNYSKTQLNDTPHSLEWNKNGSLLGVVTKEKLVNIIDPRTNKVIMTAKAHESAKAQKMCFCADTYFGTVGFNKTQREAKLYDMRKATEDRIDYSYETLDLDKQSGVMSICWDEDMKMMIIPSRGETVVHFVDVSSNQLFKLNELKLKVGPRSFTWLEKRFVDYSKSEMQRMYRYIENTLEIVSFFVPRKSMGFDPELYPDCFNGKSALSGDEWANGKDADRKRQRIDKMDSGNESMKFVKQESVVIEEDVNAKVTRLNKEVNELTIKLQDSEDINIQLRAEIDRLKDLLAKANIA